MTEKYSVQFERYGNSSNKLLCSLLKLSESFCTYFPLATSTGYVNYIRSPGERGYPTQEFWFSVCEAESEIEACQEAILSLIDANLEEPFPLHLSVVYDASLTKEF